MESKTALVTGASAGIGLAFAEVLASEGYNLVLCARRKQRLEDLGKRLEKEFSIKSYIIETDLCKADAPDQIFKELKENNISIDFLVNNAGFSLKKKFSQNSWRETEDFLTLMMTSITKLCHLALPYMKEQNHGRIINVGSVAAYVPEDSGSLYTAAKSFVLSFSKSLSKEFSHTDINVLALCPGFTYTEFHDVLGNRNKVEKFPKIMWMDAKRVAKEGYMAVINDKRVHINGFANKVICALCAVLPEKTFNLLAPKKIIENSYKV